MKAGDILDLAVAPFGMKGADLDLRPLVPRLLTLCMADPQVLAVENNLRRVKGLPELDEAQAVTSLEDEITYQAGIQNPVLAHYLAHYLAWQLGMAEESDRYLDLMMSALNALTVYEPRKIRDVWAGGDE